jgi:hypothetical protein
MTAGNPETTKGSVMGALCVFEPLTERQTELSRVRLYHFVEGLSKRTRDGRQLSRTF